MDALHNLWNWFWHLWSSLREGTRDNTIGGLIAGFVLTSLTGLAVIFRSSLARIVRHFRKPPLPIPPTPIIVNVPAPQLLPQPQTPVIEKALPAPYIPPPPLVGFVARRDENNHNLLETLTEALAPTSSQLVAVWGDGGHGKTALAAEAARALQEKYKSRIIWVSADGRADFRFSTLLDDIAQKLGRNDLSQFALEPKKAGVRAVLSEAATLVVLDNFETIVEEEQELCVEFLGRESPFPALITTREYLAAAKNIQVDKMNVDEARELLRRLIADAKIKEAVEDKEHEMILEAADWNPLVIEWVVAQMRWDQPHAVLKDLAHGEGPAVQRVFERSFTLRQLGDDGRDTLLALSLFVPSATREALAEVAGLGNDVEHLRNATRRLIDLRLIRMTAGNERLRVEGLTRQLAQKRLASDPRADEFHRRFVAHFLSYAEAHAQRTPEDFVALKAEKDNVLGAIDAAFALGDWESVTRTRAALDEFLDLFGYWGEAIRSGEQALEAARHLSVEPMIARFAHNLALIFQKRGELDEARRFYDESLEINKKLDDKSGIASTLHQLGRLAQDQGEVEEARRFYDESLEINKRLGDQHGIAGTLGQLGRLAEDEGRRKEAARLFREALSIFEKLGSPNAKLARRSLERVEGKSS